jgi:hypothetical protein
MSRLERVVRALLGPRYGVRRVMGHWALTLGGARVCWLGASVADAERTLRTGW